MNELRKLVAGNESYPPSELLWKQIVDLTEKKTERTKLHDLQDRMRREVNKYKPSLPEPKVSRFHYNSQYYYLDSKNRIYEVDAENPIVGNFVGQIDGRSVTINGEVVYELPVIQVEERELYEKKYYVDGQRGVYRGFHQNHPYVVKIGKLTQHNKIDLD